MRSSVVERCSLPIYKDNYFDGAGSIFCRRRRRVGQNLNIANSCSGRKNRPKERCAQVRQVLVTNSAGWWLLANSFRVPAIAAQREKSYRVLRCLRLTGSGARPRVGTAAHEYPEVFLKSEPS